MKKQKEMPVEFKELYDRLCEASHDNDRPLFDTFYELFAKLGKCHLPNWSRAWWATSDRMWSGLQRMTQDAVAEATRLYFN